MRATHAAATTAHRDPAGRQFWNGGARDGAGREGGAEGGGGDGGDGGSGGGGGGGGPAIAYDGPGRRLESSPMHAKHDAKQAAKQAGKAAGHYVDKQAGKAAGQPGKPAGRYVDLGVVERTAHDMASSLWCLCPAGDTCVTSRLYSAIAAGCLPVVLCDQLVGAFPSAVDYSSFWLKFPVRSFLSRPSKLLEALRVLSSNATEMARRQAALAAARADVLYDLPRSRVGSRFLEQVLGRCLPPALLDRAVNGCRPERSAAEALEALAACSAAVRGGAASRAPTRAPALAPAQQVGHLGRGGARAAANSTATESDGHVCRGRAGV